MKSINFPNMLSHSSTNTIEDKKATLNNLKLLCASGQGELFGDPFYGPGIKKYMYSQNSKLLKDVITDELYTQINVFMPQLYVQRKDIEILQNERGKLTANIRVTDRQTYETVSYSLVLFGEGE